MEIFELTPGDDFYYIPPSDRRKRPSQYLTVFAKPHARIQVDRQPEAEQLLGRSGWPVSTTTQNDLIVEV